jgi:DNA-directed RNA polymerase sigma subunit (sigma70/sigma32)
MANERRKQKADMLNDVQVTEDGLSHREIAVILKISASEVKELERMALKKLKIPNDKNKKLHKYWRIDLQPNDTKEG